MNAHPVVARLGEAGFGVVPILNMRGGDTGVLAWRRDPADLVVVTAWSDDFAVAARVPRGRDWARPFAPSVGRCLDPATFAETVEQILSGRHRLRDEPDGVECVALIEGAQ